ncbi:MAG: lectin-like domain-containing protein [Crocinitomicaceae bacterium]
MNKVFVLFVSFLLSQVSLSCTFNGSEVFISTLTPTVAYQTVSATNNNYFTMNVACGNVYNFDFCGNGGDVAGGIWAEISILNVAGNTELAFGAYTGGCTQFTWTSTFTGTVQVYITDSGCSTNGLYSGTMAYNETTGGAIDPSFTLTGTSCSSASANVTGTPGGTFSFNPIPGGGVSIDGTSGAISNGTSGATYFVDYTICGSAQNNSITLPAGDPSFSLAVACGGANATITGHTGGSFSFNPAPGDGSQVNATTGQITNGSAGTTYFVEYTVCGSSNIESITVLTDDCFTLNGDAQYITVGGEDCIQLTDEINNQTGCAWSGSQIDFASNFTLTLDYYFGNNIGGADGNTFTFQPSSSTACGQDGGQLGAGGIANSLAIEFDTYDNDNPAHVFDMSCDHIAVEIDGDMNGPGAPLCGPVCAKSSGGNIDDGGTYTVDIDWNSATQQLDIYFDGNLRLSCTHDFVTNVFGGVSQVYWGATSATGGLNNQQYFCPSTIVLLPVELTSFESICQGRNEQFNWTTSTESRVDYFTLEYTYNGLVYYPVETIKAAGTSQTEMEYSIDVETKDTKQRYYRLKMVDTDGMYEYTDIISSKRCAYSNKLINELIQKDGLLTVSTNKEVTITMTNQIGQIVKQGKSIEGITTFNSGALNAGIYFILVEDKNGQQESEKVLLNNF